MDIQKKSEFLFLYINQGIEVMLTRRRNNISQSWEYYLKTKIKLEHEIVIRRKRINGKQRFEVWSLITEQQQLIDCATEILKDVEPYTYKYIEGEKRNASDYRLFIPEESQINNQLNTEIEIDLSW